MTSATIRRRSFVCPDATSRPTIRGRCLCAETGTTSAFRSRRSSSAASIQPSRSRPICLGSGSICWRRWTARCCGCCSRRIWRRGRCRGRPRTAASIPAESFSLRVCRRRIIWRGWHKPISRLIAFLMVPTRLRIEMLWAGVPLVALDRRHLCIAGLRQCGQRRRSARLGHSLARRLSQSGPALVEEWR